MPSDMLYYTRTGGVDLILNLTPTLANNVAIYTYIFIFLFHDFQSYTPIWILDKIIVHNTFL